MRSLTLFLLLAPDAAYRFPAGPPIPFRVEADGSGKFGSQPITIHTDMTAWFSPRPRPNGAWLLAVKLGDIHMRKKTPAGDEEDVLGAKGSIHKENGKTVKRKPGGPADAMLAPFYGEHLFVRVDARGDVLEISADDAGKAMPEGLSIVEALPSLLPQLPPAGAKTGATWTATRPISLASGAKMDHPLTLTYKLARIDGKTAIIESSGQIGAKMENTQAKYVITGRATVSWPEVGAVRSEQTIEMSMTEGGGSGTMKLQIKLSIGELP